MAAGWEQEITQLLQDAQSIAVRFDVKQSLTEEQKARARNNINVNITATQVSGDDYTINFNS